MSMPGLSLRSWTVIVSMVLLVAVVQVEERRVADARQRAGDAALESANARAESDSTRAVVGNDKVAWLLRDSLRLVERLVVQRAQKQDELDRALRRGRIARHEMTVQVESLHASVKGASVLESGDAARSVRRGTFRIRQAPYTVSADVGLPESPDSGTMTVQVALDPVHVEARIGCAPADARGIRAATISSSEPGWAAIQFDRVEQSPELCASPALKPERRRHSLLPLVIGTGPVLDQQGRLSWGVFVGVAYAVGR